jgi:hypothetical protein
MANIKITTKEVPSLVRMVIGAAIDVHSLNDEDNLIVSKDNVPSGVAELNAICDKVATDYDLSPGETYSATGAGKFSGKEYSVGVDTEGKIAFVYYRRLTGIKKKVTYNPLNGDIDIIFK